MSLWKQNDQRTYNLFPPRSLSVMCPTPSTSWDGSSGCHSSGSSGSTSPASSYGENDTFFRCNLNDRGQPETLFDRFRGLWDPVFSTFMETFPPSDRPDWSSSGTEFARRSLPSPVRPRSSSPINLQPVSPVYTQHSPSQLPSPLRQQQSSSFYPTPIATGIPLTPKLIQSMPPVALALHSGKLPCYENNFSISNCQVEAILAEYVRNGAASAEEAITILLQHVPVGDRPRMREMILKRAAASARKREQSPLCAFCRNNNQPEIMYSSHTIRDKTGNVTCPVLRAYRCPECGAFGDKAHTIRYCPLANATRFR